MRISKPANVTFVSIMSLIFICLSFFSSNVSAGQWKPLCIEGSSCSVPYYVSLGGRLFVDPDSPGEYQGYAFRPKVPNVTGPLVTDDGWLLHHTPYELPVLGPDGQRYGVSRNVMLLTGGGLEDFGGGFGAVTDDNAVQLPNGKGMSFTLGSGIEWSGLADGKTSFTWFLFGWHNLNLSFVTGPPMVIGDAVYIGMQWTNTRQDIYASYDEGITWSLRTANIDGDHNRYTLSSNPENDGFWGVQANNYLAPTGLYESLDEGAYFQRVDDGSFPLAAIRIIHDPNDTQSSYAISRDGLYVSYNRGVSWQITSLTEPVNGLAFAARNIPLTRALVVGTDTGVKVSVDEAQSWLDMSEGLLEMPYTVTYAHDTLIATSDTGYFTCNRIDCAGLSQTIAPAEGEGLVEVVEFYNVNLKHYFMTSSAEEIQLIADGLAGAGWQRTGESFLAWELGSNAAATNVCRFYGSVSPGPNSHFYTLSMHDCRFLMNQQESIRSTDPRWNFEQWAFSVIPPVKDIDEPCAENLVPVYRAYNNGFARGEDSNHRYVTNPDLLAPLLDDGWTDEGVVFCSPTTSN